VSEFAAIVVPFVVVPANVWANELSKDVAPWSVSAPGVVTDPIVLIEEAPAPNVFVVEAPVPKVELPEEVSVVNAAVFGVVDPIVPGAAHVPPIKVEAFIVPVLV